MLNRIKKNIIIAGLISTLCLSNAVFALDSTISFVNINNLAYQDVEIVITDNNQILVPFKQLADIFEIKYSANRVDKQISFTTINGKSGMITQRGVFVEDYPLTKIPTVFVQQGIMDGVFNEAYIPASVAAQIMGIKLDANFEDLTLYAQVERNIPILNNLNNALVAENKGPRAYQDVVMPKKARKITLNNIGIHNNLRTDTMSVVDLNNRKNINGTFSGMTQGTLNGKILGGKYKVEATEYHYRDNAFMFGGVTATYGNSFKTKKSGKEYFYELGKVKGVTDNEISMGTNIFGAQIWNYNTDQVDPRKISGYVKPSSLVKLTVNGEEEKTISTYAGYYSLKDVQLPNPLTSLKIEEINEDGTVELISEQTFFDDKDKYKTPLAKEHRGTAFAGVWGYNNRFFREGQNIYRGNNKKITAGGEYQYGIKDNLTFKSKISGDKIYEKNNPGIVFKGPTNDALLVSGTQRSTNYREGATTINSLEWKSEKNKNVKASLYGGASIAHDVREEYTKAGYMVKGVGEYEKDITKYKKGILKPKKLYGGLELFQYSPDFYVASSDSSYIGDKLGGRVKGNVTFNQSSAGGYYSRYYSNMNHHYQGGTIKFDEAGINAQTKIPKVATLRFNGNYKRGENDFGRNKNYNYDANASRDFGRWLTLQGGRRETYYDTDFWHELADGNDYHSKYADNYGQFDLTLPKKLGKFSMRHSIVRYDSGNYKNGYNLIRFGYIFPTWKRLTLGLGWGFRYRGQGGHDFDATISYRSKSGQAMSFGYQYSQNGGYFIDNLFMPDTNRHSFNFVFNDAFQVFNHGLKSVGDEALNKGLFEAIAFVDVNKNGKFDKGDIPMDDIPLLASWTGQSYKTNKLGRAVSDSLEEGVYKVTIDMDSLPINVAPQTNDIISRYVKIDGGQTTRLEIPLNSTVGSVSGVLKISDDFDRKLKITDFIVVLLDENGDEVNYSTVGESGEFYISGLAPGTYTLQLDANFIQNYGLEELPNSIIKIVIPNDYKNPTDLYDQNLEYRALAL